MSEIKSQTMDEAAEEIAKRSPQTQSLFDAAAEVADTHAGEEMDEFEREAAAQVGTEPEPEPWQELAGHIRQHIQNQRDQAALCIQIHEGIAAALKPYHGKRVTRRLLAPIKAAFPEPEWAVFYSDYYDHYELHVRPSNVAQGRFNGRYWQGEVCVRLAAKKDPYFQPDGDLAQPYRERNAERDTQLAGDYPEGLAQAAHELFRAHLALQHFADDTPDYYALRKLVEQYTQADLRSIHNGRPGIVRPDDLR